MSKEESKKEKAYRRFRRKAGWKLATIVLFALLIISIFTGGFKDFFGTSTVVGIGSQKAAYQAVNYINTDILQGTGTAVLKDVSELSSLYKIELELGGREFESYMTKDGKFLFPEGIDMTEEKETVTTPQATGATTESYSDEDFKKIGNFVTCLEKKGFKIYGANWCGWTKSLVTTFGGFDKVEPIYVECTEEKETCSQEGITGYPTIKINGERYEDKREFEAFAKATGCEAPDIEVQVATDSGSGGCA